MIVQVFSRNHATHLTPDGIIAFISISSAVNQRKGLYDKWPVPLEGWHSVLPLMFDDVIQGHDTDPQFQPFTPEMAEQTVDFIDQLGGINVIAHCDAGMSRSVAVACFMRDFYHYNIMLHEIGTDQHRNIDVLNKLRRYYYKKHLGLEL
jgi:hypothetical protein